MAGLLPPFSSDSGKLDSYQFGLKVTLRHTLDSRAEDLIKDFTLTQLRDFVGTMSLGKEVGSLLGKNSNTD